MPCAGVRGNKDADGNKDGQTGIKRDPSPAELQGHGKPPWDIRGRLAGHFGHWDAGSFGFQSLQQFHTAQPVKAQNEWIGRRELVSLWARDAKILVRGHGTPVYLPMTALSYRCEDWGCQKDASILFQDGKSICERIGTLCIRLSNISRINKWTEQQDSKRDSSA